MSIFDVYPVTFNGMDIEQVRLHTHMFINHFLYITMTCFKRQLVNKQKSKLILRNCSC